MKDFLSNGSSLWNRSITSISTHTYQLVHWYTSSSINDLECKCFHVEKLVCDYFFIWPCHTPGLSLLDPIRPEVWLRLQGAMFHTRRSPASPHETGQWEHGWSAIKVKALPISDGESPFWMGSFMNKTPQSGFQNLTLIISGKIISPQQERIEQLARKRIFRPNMRVY